jgi:nitrite reductase/ring-hydroxylating ferredoxin subunit
MSEACDGSDLGPLLCTVQQLAESGCREFCLGEGDWPLRGFVLRVGGAVLAYVNCCPHLRYRLNYLPDDFLSADRQHIVCATHGALFEKDSGLCVSGPCLGRYLTGLPVQIHGGDVLLAAGTNLSALIERFA